MRAKKQAKNHDVKNAHSQKGFVQAKRDVAWAIYTATFDMLEAYEWAANDAKAHMVELMDIAQRTQEQCSKAAKVHDKYNRLIALSRERLSHAERLWLSMDVEASRAGLPDSGSHQVAIGRLQRCKDARAMENAAGRLRRLGLGIG